MPSSIAIGDNDSFDLIGPLTLRSCDNDLNYPYSLEGVTKGGHDVSISLCDSDVTVIWNELTKGEF